MATHPPQPRPPGEPGAEPNPLPPELEPPQPDIDVPDLVDPTPVPMPGTPLI
jgi:hypothetical protein